MASIIVCCGCAGDWVKACPTKAFSLYKRAAELGDAYAHSILGVAYFEGVGTKRDLTEAVRWTREAAWFLATINLLGDCLALVPDNVRSN
jgi:hypothetical protein